MRWLNKLGPSAVLGLTIGLFIWYQSIQTFPDPDAYYHARLAAIMLQSGLPTTFPWLPLTTLYQHFADHHLLYHVALMPAVALFGPIIGVKLMQVIFASLVIIICYFILRRWHIPYQAPALLLLLSSYPFLVRINLVKASAVAICLFLLILYFLLQKRYGLVGILTLIYTLTHGGFILAVVLATAVWSADSIAQIFKAKQYKPILPTGIFVVWAAIIIGILINPSFPNNLAFLWAQVFQIGVVNYQSVISVGAEWYPFPLTELVEAISVLLIGVVATIPVWLRQWRKVLSDEKAVSLLLLTPVFFILTLRSRRFVEYFIPLLWLLICLLVLPAWQAGIIQPVWQSITRRLGHWAKLLNMYIVVTTIGTIVIGVIGIGRSFYQAKPIDRFAQAGAYLQSVAEPNEIVFHGRWDDFPALFYYAPKASYMAGLDPTFLYLADKNLYQHWNDIATGRAKQQTASNIRDYFQVRYVVVDESDSHTQLMLAYLLRDKTAKLVFHQKPMAIFKLVEL
ncbi:MAG: hypothetical protein WCV88_03785 [Patescibacteria group bacterium]|jgi:hypothetical protein